LEDARYEAVTLADIKAVARKYLTPDALVLAVIKPPDDSKAAQEQALAGTAVKR
jgi:predicted Zn-dependent peptidase